MLILEICNMLVLIYLVSMLKGMIYSSLFKIWRNIVLKELL